MPDLTGNSAFDVVVGLAFVFFSMSIVASAINEVIAAALNMRARTLESWLRALLSKDVPDPPKPDAMPDEEWERLQKSGVTMWDRFRVQNRWMALKMPKLLPLVTLRRDGMRVSMSRSEPTRRPSYVAPRAFALTLLDTLAPTAAGEGTNVLEQARESAKKLPDGYLKTMLTDAFDKAGRGRDAVVAEIESAFDEAMDRLSGRYKRWSQVILLVVGLVVAGALNVDTFAIADRLYTNPAVREAVVSEAVETVEKGAIDRCVAEKAGNPAQAAADCVDEVDQLGLPLGWAEENTPDDAWSSLGKALGLLVTAFAISLGAPFWFDLLGKFARLRATGKREGTGKDDGRAAVDRDDRSRTMAGGGG